MLRVSVAAKRLGVHPQTLRLWADEGRVPVTLVGRERRFREADRASGLRENRPGLRRLLDAAGSGDFNVVRVTHEDRLARFGSGWLGELLARDGVRVEVLHPKGSAGGMDESLADFMSLIATFAGRMYGIRSKENRRRLLAEAGERLGGGR